MKKVIPSILFALCLGFLSCNNIFNSSSGTAQDASSNPKIRITRYFDIAEGAVPQDFLPSSNTNAKTAFPKVSPGNTTYIAILKNTTTGEEISTDNNRSEISIDIDNKSISLELTVNNSYIITVRCVNYDFHQIVYLEGSCDEFTITPKKTVFSDKFLLQPSLTGEGSVELSIDHFELTEESIRIIRVRNLITGADVTGDNLFILNRYGNKVILLSGSSGNPDEKIPSGQYSVEIEMRDSIQRIYYIKEVINVFNNLKTNIYVISTPNEYYETDDQGTISINITKEKTKNFVSSTKYVDSNSQADFEEGTWTKPFTTLAKAIVAIPSDSSNGYIHIKDGHSETTEGGFNITKNLSIECYKDMPGDEKGNATIKRGNDTYLFHVGESDGSITASFDIAGITCDGAHIQSNDDGLFLTVYQNCTVTVTNCTAINTYAVNIDSGCAIRNSGTLTLNNCIFKNNEIFIEESDFDSSKGQGGAIFNEGTLTLNNTEITDNTAYIGGGVYTTKPITVLGKTIIKENQVISKSTSPVYSDSNLYLAKTTVTSTVQTYIDCTAEPADGTEIYFTTETPPTPGEPVKVITNCYGSVPFNPNTYFFNEEGYTITKNGSNTDAYLKIGGGKLLAKTFNDITISIDKNCFKKSDSGTDRYFTFTVSDGTTTHTKKDSDVTKVTIELYKNDEKYVTSGIALNETFSMLFPAKKTSGGAEYDMPFGIYTAIASVTYKNKTYQADFDIEYCDTYPSLKYVTDLPEAGTTYAVSTKEELEKIKDWATDGNLKNNPIEIVLTSDIVVDNSFSGIGSARDTRFEGTINGNNHTISGLTKSLINFGKGTIKNLTIEGNITGHAAFISNYTSGNNGASGKITIENCINKANINNNTRPESGHSVDIGAFVGTNDGNETTIVNCINYGNITADTYIASIYIGGITGASSATIINCANYGNINGQCYSGGITPKPCTIKNCVNYGNVTGNCAGGITSFINITSLYAKSYSIQNCVNFGTIIGKKPSTTDPSVGQIIGNLKVDDGKSDLFDYDYCYYLKGKDSTGADYTAVGSSSGYTKTPEYIHDFTFDPNATDNLQKYKITYEDAGITITEYLLQILNSYATTFPADGCCQWKLDASIPPKPILDFSTITP